jgi:outer membrane protein OmpA-like peptidoglycan-associated protein
MKSDRLLISIVLFAFAAALLAAPACAAGSNDDRKFVGEFGPIIGVDWADEALVGNGHGPDSSPLFGLRWATRLSPRWNWFADGDYTEPASPVEDNTKMFEGRTGFERLFPFKSGKANWFISGALGGADVNFPDADVRADFGRPLLSLGVGMAKERGGIRGELRAEQLLGDSGINGADVTNIQLVFGWMFPFYAQQEKAAVFEKGQETLVLEGVHFETNSANLTQESYSILDDVAAKLRDNPKVKVEIQGHTDEVGTPEYNQDLSQRRAETVRDYLVSKGVKEDRLVAKGYGATRPVASNDTDEGRAKNRRVELKKL